MKTKIFSLISAVALAIGFSACTDDNWDPAVDNKGEVRLSSMAVDIDVKENLQSRAEYDLSDFIVELRQGDAVAKKFTYSQMPEIVQLEKGDYTAVVYSHDVQSAEWDNPYFLGQKDFKIEPNVITEIGTITCKFASVKVTVVFDQELKEHMGNDCQVTVVANNAGTLIFGRDETRPGYFKAIDGSYTLVATFEGTVDGALFSNTQLQKQITDVVAGTHYHLTYSYKKSDTSIPDEVGSVDVDADNGVGGISIDFSATDANEGCTINISDDVIDTGDRPGTEGEEDPKEPDEPVTPDDPSVDITFTSATLKFAPEINGTDVTPAIANIHSGDGYAHLNVTIETTSDNFRQTVSELLPLEFDLVNPEEQYVSNFKDDLGFPVGDDFKGKTDIDFDITAFIPLLAPFPGTHTFSIEVVDLNGQKKQTSIIIKSE